MKIVVLSSLAVSLVNFRGRLLEDLVKAGHEVIACAPDHDEWVIAALDKVGVGFRQTPMARAGMNPFRDLRTFLGYWSLMLSVRPEAVIAYTQKPIIYGGLAARVLRRPFFAIMSGLGYAFSEESNHRHLLRRAVAWLYRHALRKARLVFVFNSDDARCMATHGIIDGRPQVLQVPGSGVDVDRFAEQPMPDGPPTFIMIGRLMRDKGIDDYVAAATIVRRSLPEARFRLLGRPETNNPTGYPIEQVMEWAASGLIEYIPECRDVRPHLAGAHIFVLPSYYREGLPRTLLEALATGRPVITTDMPGCREPVIPGENGWLVRPRDPGALADAMLTSIKDRDLLERMGKRARAIAVEHFDVVKVNRLLLQSMRLHELAAPVRESGISVATPEYWRGNSKTFTRAMAGILLLLIAPLLSIVALLVLLTLGPPVLFRQERGGLNGGTFTMVKFRTMTVRRDSSGGLLPDEQRRHPIGQFLRRSRLDELPELANIVRGEMVFVGPRPLLTETIRKMGELGLRRSSVLPGITGWAQVNGNALLSNQEKLGLDLWYVANQSSKLDLQILARTVVVVVLGERRVHRKWSQSFPVTLIERAEELPASRSPQ